MDGLRKRPFAIAVLTALISIVIGLAAVQVSRYARYGDMQYWASKIEQGQSVPRKTIAALAPKVSELVHAGECQAPFIKAGLTILLIDLDNRDPDLEYEAWSEALRRAEEFALHALTCLPTDGNLWLRLAMVKQAITERPDEIVRLVTLSQLYAPAEEKVLTGRYLLYNRFTAETLDLLSGPLSRDLQIMCSPVVGNLRKRLPPPGQRLAAIIPQVAPGCPEIGAARGRR